MNAINCDGSHCIKHETEIRKLPIGSGFFNLCEECFNFEMTFRKQSNRHNGTNYPIPNWIQLRIYDPK